MLKVVLAYAALLPALALSSGSATASTQATITLGQLQIQLTDLRPEDGIAPALVWNDSWLLGVGTYDGLLNYWAHQGSGAAQQYEARWQYGPFLWQRSEWGQPSLTQASSLGIGQQMAGFEDGLLALSVSAMLGSDQIHFGESFFVRAFGLGPGTQVTISALVDTHLSGTAYQGSWVPPDGLRIDPHSSVRADVRIETYDFQSVLLETATTGWLGSDGFDLGSSGQSLSLVIANESDDTRWHLMRSYIGLNAHELSAPIPEPQSYALMGAGLLVLGLRKRARRRL